jgi:hypothetical protein
VIPSVKKRYAIGALVMTLFLTLLTPYSANSWELNSENSRTGIVTSAAQFWVEGYGPIAAKDFFFDNFEDDTYWASLSLYCERKTLTAYIYLSQIGSGHDDLRLDDPGYISVTLNGSTTKRYRTYGTGMSGTIAIRKDAKAFAQSLLSKKTLTTTLRIRYGNRIPLKFTVSDLSKARTRFKYAGCPF